MALAVSHSSPKAFRCCSCMTLQTAAKWGTLWRPQVLCCCNRKAPWHQVGPECLSVMPQTLGQRIVLVSNACVAIEQEASNCSSMLPALAMANAPYRCGKLGATIHWPYSTAGALPNMRMVLLVCHVRHLQPASGLVPQQAADEQALQHRTFWQGHVDHPLQGRRALVNSVCPSLAGLFDVKLALLLVLLGGVPSESKDARTRGQPHMLMVGDPGTGKSQLMKFIAQLAPRCSPEQHTMSAYSRA